jgi:small-conductance mechanosensitive channel
MSLLERLGAGSRILRAHLFEIGDTTITLEKLIIFFLLIVLTLFVSRVLRRGLVKGLRMRGVTDEGTTGVARRLLHYLVMAVGLLVALETIGINMGALFAAGAVFAIGLGFAMQNIAQNFVSGIILLVERTIKPGDVLQINDRMVKVRSMSIRATIARTLDEEDIIIPNASIVQAMVTNYTLQDNLYRLRSKVGVVYGSDMRQVREVLEASAAALEWRYQGRDPVVLLTDFGDSSVNFEVSVWIDDPWRVRSARSDLNEAVWWALKEAGVVIAFPQVDVHFDPDVTGSLRSLGRAS